MSQTVLHLAPTPALDAPSQWRIESLQLVNWGGFDGHVTVDLSTGGTTLLTGASGSGKSTLMDAYLALMMPSSTPFNGASNDMTVGRARGADQRNLLTYLRGKVADQREEGTGELTNKVLRGADSATWGAVAATFTNDHQQQFTALRVYAAPRAATRTSDVSLRMATVDGRFNLRHFEVLGGRLEKKVLRATFPTLSLYDSYETFAAALHTRLGIGEGGDGHRALRLLARIQGGHQIRTVNDLYKQMVLEQPSTYEAADRAIEHFAALDASYEAMVEESRKQDVLAPITQHRDDLQKAQDRLARRDSLGSIDGGDSPFELWRLGRLEQLLETECTSNREREKTAAARLRQAKELKADLAVQLEQVRQARRDNGGDALERLTAEIAEAQVRLSDRTSKRERLRQRLAGLDLPVDTGAEFTAAQVAAERFFATAEDQQAEWERERDALRAARHPLLEERRMLEAEHASLRDREGRVPKRLHDVRLLVAEAAGLDVSDLPFAAELMDVAEGQERWRTAIEVTLGSIARTILVDARDLDRLSRAIDPLPLSLRIRFEGVDLSGQQPPSGAGSYVSDKLVFKDSPFARAVHQMVSSRGVDHLCVEDPGDLHGEGARVTPAGQTRRGRRGEHGRSQRENIIGFSNADRLAEITAELAELTARIDELDEAVHRLDQSLRGMDRHRSAYQALQDVSWSDIDVQGVRAEIEEKEARRAQIIASSDILRTLAEQETRLDREYQHAADDLVRAGDAQQRLDQEWADLVDRQDRTVDELSRIERSGVHHLTTQQRDVLDAILDEVSTGDLTRFDKDITLVRRHLAKDAEDASAEIQRAAAAMCRVFEEYQRTWPDPNLGTSVQSYPDYAEILERITTSGLADRRHEWSRRLSEWSGQDLVPLAGAFDRAVEEIRERLAPVNDILATLPFGAARNRLHIDMRNIDREKVMAFRSELRYLASGVTADPGMEELEERFTRLRAFMARIKPSTGGERTERDELLDVRRYIDITAVELNQHGEQVAVYATLGEKSGGESQELVAFIVGAALRFQLGDEDRAHPRFAPVFLDEGFIKADAEFAGRSVEAWQGLGFQLVIGAPLDKVSGLEPYADRILMMTKTHQGYSTVVPYVAVDE